MSGSAGSSARSTLATAMRSVLVAAGLIGAAPNCATPWTIDRLHDDLASLRRQVDREGTSPTGTETDGKKLVLLRAAVHVHSKYSHDSDGSIAEIARAARACGVQVVFLTDHSNPAIFEHCPEGFVDGVFFVRGEEISKNGSVLALGTSSSIRSTGKDMQDVISDVVDGGGVAAIGHLESTDARGVSGYSAVSIHNLHADAKRIPFWLYPKVWLDALLYGSGRANEIMLHDIVRRSGPELATWDAMLAGERVAAIAEVDAHQNLEVLGLDLDPYRRILRVLHTYLIVPENWTRADLLDAVGRGRSYIGFSLIADPTGFSFEGRQADGRAVGVGEGLPFHDDLELRIASPAPGEILVMKNGKEYARSRGRNLKVACDSPGVYRAEVRVRLNGKMYPWIVSNPIYVEQAAATVVSSSVDTHGHGSSTAESPAGE